jgi:hypothetical protein
MAFTRGERLSLQKKQEKISVKEGAPPIGDLDEGVPVLRLTDEGLVQYAKFNNVLYKIVFEKS